jgi:predicted DNA-binding transcriptional regulator AlpA
MNEMAQTSSQSPSAARGGRSPAQAIYPDGLYRWRDLEPRIPLTREGWRYKVNNGTAPKPVTRTRHFTAWRGRDILAWLQDPDGYNADEARSTPDKE